MTNQDNGRYTLGEDIDLERVEIFDKNGLRLTDH